MVTIEDSCVQNPQKRVVTLQGLVNPLILTALPKKFLSPNSLLAERGEDRGDGNSSLELAVPRRF